MISDEANQELNFQSEERARNHNKLLKDIEALQIQAENIHKRIGRFAGKKYIINPNKEKSLR